MAKVRQPTEEEIKFGVHQKTVDEMWEDRDFLEFLKEEPKAADLLKGEPDEEKYREFYLQFKKKSQFKEGLKRFLKNRLEENQIPASIEADKDLENRLHELTKFLSDQEVDHILNDLEIVQRQEEAIRNSERRLQTEELNPRGGIEKVKEGYEVVGAYVAAATSAEKKTAWARLRDNYGIKKEDLAFAEVHVKELKKIIDWSEDLEKNKNELESIKKKLFEIRDLGMVYFTAARKESAERIKSLIDFDPNEDYDKESLQKINDEKNELEKFAASSDEELDKIGDPSKVEEQKSLRDFLKDKVKLEKFSQLVVKIRDYYENSMLLLGFNYPSDDWIYQELSKAIKNSQTDGSDPLVEKKYLPAVYLKLGKDAYHSVSQNEDQLKTIFQQKTGEKIPGFIIDLLNSKSEEGLVKLGEIIVKKLEPKFSEVLTIKNKKYSEAWRLKNIVNKSGNDEIAEELNRNNVLWSKVTNEIYLRTNKILHEGLEWETTMQDVLKGLEEISGVSETARQKIIEILNERVGFFENRIKESKVSNEEEWHKNVENLSIEILKLEMEISAEKTQVAEEQDRDRKEMQKKLSELINPAEPEVKAKEGEKEIEKLRAYRSAKENEIGLKLDELERLEIEMNADPSNGDLRNKFEAFKQEISTMEEELEKFEADFKMAEAVAQTAKEMLAQNQEEYQKRVKEIKELLTKISSRSAETGLKQEKLKNLLGEYEILKITPNKKEAEKKILERRLKILEMIGIGPKVAEWRGEKDREIANLEELLEKLKMEINEREVEEESLGGTKSVKKLEAQQDRLLKKFIKAEKKKSKAEERLQKVGEGSLKRKIELEKKREEAVKEYRKFGSEVEMVQAQLGELKIKMKDLETKKPLQRSHQILFEKMIADLKAERAGKSWTEYEQQLEAEKSTLRESVRKLEVEIRNSAEGQQEAVYEQRIAFFRWLIKGLTK